MYTILTSIRCRLPEKEEEEDDDYTIRYQLQLRVAISFFNRNFLLIWPFIIR